MEPSPRWMCLEILYSVSWSPQGGLGTSRCRRFGGHRRLRRGDDADGSGDWHDDVGADYRSHHASHED
eukprot:9416238-Pyramimonas_sp.AAC.1